MQGTGALEALDLATRVSHIELVGTARAELLVSHKLEARVTGTGGVRYRGEPEVSAGVVGPGEVTPL